MCVCARVYARIYARMYARASDCRQIASRTHDQDQDQDQDTRPRPAHLRKHDQRKKEEHRQSGKPEYICMIAGNEKKVQKKLKKICKYEKRL